MGKWLLDSNEEKKIKKKFEYAIKDTAKEYRKILEKHWQERFPLFHSESDVRNVLYYNLRRRIEKNKKLREIFHFIVSSEYPSSERGEESGVSKRIDFSIYNLRFSKKKLEKVRGIVDVEIKLEFYGFRKKRFKKKIKNDFNKLIREWKENKKGEYYLLFIHTKKYDKNFEGKKQEFKKCFEDLKKKRKLKHCKIKFYYVQKNEICIW